MLLKRYISIISVSLIVLNMCIIAQAGNQIEYEKNEHGKTFGNDIQASIIGYEADLILAIGEDNVCGYIKSSDLNDDVRSPQDAISTQKNLSNGKRVHYIPIYEKNGTNVIGKFSISINESSLSVRESISNYTCGSTGYINVGNNYECTTISGIRVAICGVRGITQITSNETVNVGWLGVQARVYKDSNGALVRSTNFYYNNERANGYEQTGFHETTLNVGYYSKGIVKTWNPTISNYWTTDTFRSPCINP